ncbi:MAG: hypothetical protein Q8R16_00875, partial [bacterium]|nr:hypothetical protein [bacterium]
QSRALGKSSFFVWLREQLVKLLLSVIATAICGIPLWMYLGARHLLSPNGFWQEFLLLGLGVWILGLLQVIGVLALLSALFVLWLD